MKARKLLAMFIALLMICTCVNLVPAVTASAKTVDHQSVSASNDEDDYEDPDDDEDSDDDDDGDNNYDGNYSDPIKFNNYIYRVNITDDTARIVGYYGTAKSVTIPATLQNHKVTEIESLCDEDDEDDSDINTLKIGNNVVKILSNACSYFPLLKTVNIESSVRIIEQNAFSGCEELSTVNIKDGVKVIESEAFAGCPKLKSISLPNTVNRVGAYSFGYNTNDDGEYVKIKGFKISGYDGSNVQKYANGCGFTYASLGKYTKADDKTNYLYTVEDREITITDYLGTGGNVVVPDEIDGIAVVNIMDNVFADYYYSYDLNYLGNPTYYKNFDFITSLTLPKYVYDYYVDSQYYLPKLNTMVFRNNVFIFDENTWGFMDNDSDNDPVKIKNFTIKGYTDSSAEDYAKENGFKFVSIGSYTPDVTEPTTEEPSTIEPTTSSTQPTVTTTSNTNPTVTSTNPTTVSTTVPERVVNYPTETAMEQLTYTLPTVEDNMVYSESITLNKSKVTLLSNKSVKLVAKLSPSNAKGIIWTTSNGRVATVENGVVKAKSKGQATITAKTTDGTELSAKCVVTVKQSVNAIKLNKTLINSKKGTKVKLTATVSPVKADNRVIKWQTSNKKIATVNNKGQVTVKGKGIAIITCNSGDGSGVKAICVVNNSTKAKSIKFSKTNVTVNAGKTTKLTPAINGKCKAVSYSSSNKKVATVNMYGLVTGIENGKSTIVAKLMDGSKKTAKYTVTVSGHNFGSWKITKNPTCINEGTMERVCSSCKKTEIKKINKVSHNWDDEYTVVHEPTCTESGLAVIKCTVCGEERKPYIIPALGHCYDKSVIKKEATCTDDGLVTRECTVCGHIEEKEVEHLGHVWSSEKKVLKNSTCQQTGLKAYTCLYCDATSAEEEIPKTAHKYTILVSAECVQPTCETQGVSVYKCSECGDKTTKVIPALGHDWNTESTVDIQATCQNEGKTSVHCKRCDKTKDEKVIPKISHNYNNGVVIKKASLTENGVKSSSCNYCGSIKNESIPKIDTVKLSSSQYIYDGKAKTPTVTVSDFKGTKLVENTSYTLSGSKSATKVGTYTITVEFKGSYSGKTELTYKINPKGTTITSLTSAKNQFTVKWAKQTTETTGYVIYYATKSNLSDKKYVVLKNNTTTSQTVTGLTSNKKYYVAVRTIKDFVTNGKTTRYYSTVSPKKTVTIK